MKTIWFIIYSILGIAFLVITYMKYGPASEQTPANTDPQNYTNARVLTFWEMYNKAGDLRIAGDYQTAAEYYRRALQKNPDHLDAIYYLGSMELAMANYEKAEQQWLTLITKNPASARGHVQLGTVYSCSQPGNPLFNLQQATSHFKKASKLNREISGPLLQLAKIDILNQRFGIAEERLHEVTQSNFRSLEGHFLLGYLAWKTKNGPQANKYLDESRSIAEGSEQFANIGEGATDSGGDPMFDKANRCALFLPDIRMFISKYINNPSYGSANIFGAFDNKISSIN